MSSCCSIDRLCEIQTAQLGHFPVGRQIEFEGSTISIPITASLPNGWISTEHIDFQAFMRLELDRRVRNQLGRAQFEFNIAVWELYGKSELLTKKFGRETYITFTLSPKPQKQPRSICFANQEGPDFPATIIYNACYDVYAGREKMVDSQMGIAICTPITALPPRGVMVAFEKPFEDQELGISFGRGCCWGMHLLEAILFLAGVNRARAIRGWSQVDDPYGDFPDK